MSDTIELDEDYFADTPYAEFFNIPTGAWEGNTYIFTGHESIPQPTLFDDTVFFGVVGFVILFISAVVVIIVGV